MFRILISDNLGQHFNGFFQSEDQQVNFLERIIERERSSYRPGDLIEIHDWLCTVMPGTNSNTHLVNNGANIIWMKPFDIE